MAQTINAGKIQYSVGFQVDKAGLNELKTELQKISTLSLNTKQIQQMNPGLSINEVRSSMMKLRADIGKIEDAFSNAFNSTTGITNIQKLNKSFQSFDLSRMREDFSKLGIVGEQAFSKIAARSLTTNLKFKETNGILEKMGQTLMNTLKWQISSSAINRFTGAVQQAYGYVQHLDTSLNDIRIVTGKSADEMERFARTANKAAKSLGASTTDYTEAALIYYQQGLSDEEANARAATTLKAANVTGQSGAAVSEELTAVWNGYKVSAEETELAVDKLAAVAATTAADLEELSVGMSKVASAANNMGVDMDQLNAMIATIVSITRQAPESVGTALKTIFARMSDLKLGDTDEDGLKLGDVSGSLEKVGISILDTNGDLREMGDVIEEVASKWDTWTKAQQAAIAQSLAGKRQYNNLVALFDNWDMYSNALNTSQNSMGTLQKQQDVYMESTEAHLQVLQTQWEDLYDSLLDTDTINNITDAFTKIIGVVTKFVDSIGGMKGVFFGLSALITKVFNQQLSTEISNIIVKFKNAKDNVAMLNAELSLTKKWAENKGLMPGAVQEIISLKEHAQQYYDIMSEGEIQHYNDLIDQAAELLIIKQEQDAIAENYQKEMKARAAGQKGMRGTADARNDVLNKMDVSNPSTINVESSNQVLETATKTTEGLVDLNRKVAESYKEVQKTLETNIFSQDAYNKAIENAGKAEDEYIKAINKMINANNLSEEDQKRLQNAINKTEEELKAYYEAIANGESSYSLGSKKRNITIALNKEKQIIEEVTETAKRKNEELAKTGKDLSENLNEARQNADNFVSSIKATEQLDLRRTISSITNVVQGLSTMAFSLQSIKSLFKTLSDDNMSWGDKLLQSFMSLSMIAPGVLEVISSINAVRNASIAITNLESGATAAKIALEITDGTVKTKLTQIINKESRAFLELKVAEELENGSLSKDTQQTIANILARQQEQKEVTGLSGKIAGLAKKFEALPGKAKLATVGIAALAIGLTAYYKAINKAEEERLKRNYEDAKASFDNTNEKIESAKKEQESIEELTKSYLQIYNQRDAQNNLTEEQQDQIYELVKAYGDEDFIVKALKGDYDELADSIKAVNKQKNEELFNKASERISSGQSLLQAGMAQEKVLGSAYYAEWFVNATDQEIADFFKTNENKKLWKYYQENKDLIAEIREAQEEQKKSGLNKIGYEFDTSSIRNYQDYELALKSLTSQAVSSGLVTEEEGAKWAKEFLDGVNTGFKNYSDKDSFQKTLVEGLKFSETEIQKFIADNPISAASFLSSNIELANSYESLDKFKEAYEGLFDRLEDQDISLKVKTALVNSEGKEFKQEDIDEIFKDKTLTLKVVTDKGTEENIAITQEQFENETFEQQQGHLLAYYLQAGKLENEFQAQKRADIEEEYTDRQNKLAENQANYEAMLESIRQEFSLQDNAVGFTDSSYFNTVFQQDLSSEDLDHIQELADKFSEALQDGLTNNADEFDFIAGQVSENDLNILSTLASMSEEQRNQVLANIKANKKYREELDELGLEYKKASDITQDFIKANEEIESISDLVEKAELSWAEWGEAVQNALKATNSSIDNLQSAYSSLTSVMEEYNETGQLSMDNLQTFLNMDTAYLSALQMENGQMSLNEQALQQIALARLDEAEAEAYEQAMAELNDEARRREIEGIGTASQSLEMLGNAAVDAANAARSGIGAWQAYWAAALNKEGISNDAYAQQVGQALYVKLQAINSVRQRILSGDLGGALGGSKSSSSGSEKEAKHEEYLKREHDIYRKINTELDQISNKLDRIDEIESHSWGVSYLDALQEENKLLDEQLEKLEEKKALQIGDLGQRKKQLENEGFTFNENGSLITNVEDRLDALYASYNTNYVDKYNSMSADAQEEFEAEMKAEEDRIKQIEDAVGDYEKLYGDYEDLIKELQDLYYKQIEKDVEEFNFEIDLELELSDARKEWKDFWHDVVKDVESDDFVGQIAKSFSKLGELIGVGGSSNNDVLGLTQHLKETLDEVNTQITTHGLDGLFGTDTKLSEENLTNYRDKLMNALKDAKGEIENISDNYLSMLESAQDMIDKQVEGWENIGDQINHNLELIKLISGENTYDALAKQYEQQYENNLQTIEAQRIGRDYWKEKIAEYKTLLAAAEEGTEEYKTLQKALDTSTEKYIEANKELNSTVEGSIKNLQEWRKNSVSAITEVLDKAISGGLGTDMLEQEWKLINDYADQYFDNVERAVNMEEYTNVLQDAANATGLTAKNQEKINKFMDEELKKLNEKEKLTQYDIDESKARLEILKAEMALQDAQRNKSNMRLRRDNQGNYTYQYTGNEQAIEDAEKAGLTARKAWYELVKKRNKETNDYIIQLEKDRISLMNQLDEAELAGDEERANKLKELLNRNEEQIVFAYGEAQKTKQDLFSGTAQYFADVENAEILPMWDATVTQLVDRFAGDNKDSFITACKNAINELDIVQERYVEKTQRILNIAGVKYQKLVEDGIDPTKEAIEELNGTNEELAEGLDDTNEKLDEMRGYLEECAQAYRDFKDDAVSAIQEANQALETLARTHMDTVNQINANPITSLDGGGGFENDYYVGGNNGRDNGYTPNIGSPYSPEKAPEKQASSSFVVKVDNSTGHIIGEDPNNPFTAQRALNNQLTATFGSTKGAHFSQGLRYSNGQWYVFAQTGADNLKKFLKLKNYTFANSGQQAFIGRIPIKFKSGGYTGDWSGQGIDGMGGRMAVLHQKELVLNESDTSNMLAAVEALRQINIDKLAQSILATSIATAQMQIQTQLLSAQLSGLRDQYESSRNTTINADFSGVRTADEILRAFEELENYGLQQYNTGDASYRTY